MLLFGLSIDCHGSYPLHPLISGSTPPTAQHATLVLSIRPWKLTVDFDRISCEPAKSRCFFGKLLSLDNSFHSMASVENILKPMTFSPPVFAALTPVLYLLAHLKPQDSKAPPCRANGRSSPQFRQPLINTNSLTYCNGSAVARVGDTACVCGVRAEILRYEDVPNQPRVDLSSTSDSSDTPEDDAKTAEEAAEISSLHLLVPNIDLGTTGCSPSIPPGQAPSTLAQSLSQRLYSLLTS